MPRGIENKVAINMVVGHIQQTLLGKSKKHQAELQRLGKQVEDEPLSPNAMLMKQTRQITAMNTIIQNPMTDEVDFIFYFDRLATLLVQRSEVYRIRPWPAVLTECVGQWIPYITFQQRCGHRLDRSMMGFDLTGR